MIFKYKHDWEIIQDPETGIFGATCNELNYLVQGNDLNDLFDEIKQITNDLIDLKKYYENNQCNNIYLLRL